MFVVLDTDRWECVPCFTPVLGRGDDVAVFNAATAEIGRLLRRFERAERVAGRGRKFAPLAGVLGRVGAGAGASRSLGAALVGL